MAGCSLDERAPAVASGSVDFADKDALRPLMGPRRRICYVVQLSFHKPQLEGPERLSVALCGIPPPGTTQMPCSGACPAAVHVSGSEIRRSEPDCDAAEKEKGADPEKQYSAMRWAGRGLSWHDCSRCRFLSCDDEEDTGGSERAEVQQRAVDVSCSVEVSPGEEADVEEELLQRVGRHLAKRGVHGWEAEVLLTAPAPVPLRGHSDEELHCTVQQLRAEAGLERSVNAFLQNGLLLLQDGVSCDCLQLAAAVVQERIQQAEAALKARGVAAGRDAFAFREMGSRGGHRFDLLLDLDGPGLDGITALARSGPWMPLVERLLAQSGGNPGFRVWVSVVYSRPGAPDQEWHSDGDHVGTIADWQGNGASPPYGLCVFVPLIDLSPTVGFTQFWPRSHTHPGLLGFGAASAVLDCTVDGLLPAGGCAVYDYRLVHRGMGNRSVATVRPVLQFFYHDVRYHERKNYGHVSLFADAARPS